LGIDNGQLASACGAMGNGQFGNACGAMGNWQWATFDFAILGLHRLPIANCRLLIEFGRIP
jgi:hypothetical protein